MDYLELQDESLNSPTLVLISAIVSLTPRKGNYTSVELNTGRVIVTNKAYLELKTILRNKNK